MVGCGALTRGVADCTRGAGAEKVDRLAGADCPNEGRETEDCDVPREVNPLSCAGDWPDPELRLPNRLLRSRAAAPSTEKMVAMVKIVRVRLFMVSPLPVTLGEQLISTSVSVDT